MLCFFCYSESFFTLEACIHEFYYGLEHFKYW
ncbi:hypothetical protein L195_g063898, partial [Trifolium pratense]